MIVLKAAAFTTPMMVSSMGAGYHLQLYSHPPSWPLMGPQAKSFFPDALSLVALLAFIYYAPAIYKRIINNVKVRPPKPFYHFSNAELYTWISS